MREIKFRAWDIDEKAMVQLGNMTDLLIEMPSRRQLEAWNYMQYTGLKDKNGVEIYEGEIIRVNGATRDVRFAKGSFIANHDEHCSTNLSAWEARDLEVIGNIYEHSHLLETNQ